MDVLLIKTRLSSLFRSHNHRRPPPPCLTSERWIGSCHLSRTPANKTADGEWNVEGIFIFKISIVALAYRRLSTIKISKTFSNRRNVFKYWSCSMTSRNQQINSPSSFSLSFGTCWVGFFFLYITHGTTHGRESISHCLAGNNHFVQVTRCRLWTFFYCCYNWNQLHVLGSTFFVLPTNRAE